MGFEPGAFGPPRLRYAKKLSPLLRLGLGVVELVEPVCPADAAEVVGFLGLSCFGVVKKALLEDCGVTAFLGLVLAVAGLTSPPGVAGLGSFDFPGPFSFLGLEYGTFCTLVETDWVLAGNVLAFFGEE